MSERSLLDEFGLENDPNHNKTTLSTNDIFISSGQTKTLFILKAAHDFIITSLYFDSASSKNEIRIFLNNRLLRKFSTPCYDKIPIVVKNDQFFKVEIHNFDIMSVWFRGRYTKTKTP